jgi:Macrocin-O-methyltransferase (TylF)
MTKDMQQVKSQPQSIELRTHKIHNGEISSRSQQESDLDSRLLAVSKELLPQYGGNWGVHGLVTLKRMALSRVIYYYELYQKIIEVPGVICEFGVQWGATLALLQNLRGMYEPYNVSRKIFGFDTFEGFATVEAKDGPLAKLGDYKSLPNYEETLEEILSIHEAFCPISHIKKFELIKGDASVTIDKWVEENPHAIISMAIFDMDVYKPTKDVLEKIIPRLTKGSLLVFDELNCQHFPGETAAVQEVLGLNNLTLKRFPHQSYCAWAVFGE